LRLAQDAGNETHAPAFSSVTYPCLTE
jgi:hypothetical protein